MNLTVEKYVGELRNLRTYRSNDWFGKFLEARKWLFQSNKTNMELRDRLRATESELRYQEDTWFGRRKEAERMHKLRTVNLERHNKALGDLIIRDAALRLNPPLLVSSSVIVKTNEPELKCLRKENEQLRNDMAKIGKITDWY